LTDSNSKQPPQSSKSTLQQVKSIIAIASGKGGVGKSSTAIHLGLALKQLGLRVGLMDADIYGPSQPTMLGVPQEQRPDVVDGKFFLPIEKFGLQTMSMGYLTTEKTPMAWRGPMATGALMQMLNQTRWPALDILLVDMPPGTGDIQLTFAQQVPCAGFVIVTTPQTVAVMDAQKGIELFNKLNIPCLGVVENMATHICRQCGSEEAIFGEGGGQRVADDYGVEFLGQLPLHADIRASLDCGEPLLVRDPASVISQAYIHTAEKIVSQLAEQDQVAPPTIEISDE